MANQQGRRRREIEIAVVGVLALVFAAFSFTYRFSTMGGPLGGFEDDQFVHLSEAQQIILGESPSGDFIDIGGMPLTLWLSSSAQRVFGHTLLAEAVLTMTMLGACAAVLFLLSWRISGSIAIAATVTLIQIAMAPRFYNYPKLLAYALGIPALWWYIDRPNRRRLAVLAAAGVVAFLLRYDHGVYLGLTAVITVAMLHRCDYRVGLREIVVLGLCALLLLSPYLLFVQVHGGIYRELRSFVSYAQWATSRTDLKATERAFHFDTALPLTGTVPAEVRSPTIRVRWASSTPDDERNNHERLLHLTPVEQVSSDGWVYRVAELSPATLKAIVHDPLVADTQGIDRESFTLNNPDYTRQPTRVERLLQTIGRVRIAPGFIQSANAVPFLFWTIALLPSVTLLVAIATGLRRASTENEWSPWTTKIVTVAFLGVLMTPGLLRGNLTSRFADVTEVAGVCSAWLAAVAFSRRAALPRMLASITILVIALLAVLSIGTIENVRGQIAQSGLPNGFNGVSRRLREVRAQLSSTPPFNAWQPSEPGDPQVARYLHDCTEPTDRILTLAYAPQMFFMSGRGFAAGVSYVRPELFAAETDQRLMIDRMRIQRVPIVITAPDPAYMADYVESFPLLDELLRQQYRYVSQVDFGRGRVYRVLVRKDLKAVRNEPRHGLPCFA